MKRPSYADELAADFPKLAPWLRALSPKLSDRQLYKLCEQVSMMAKADMDQRVRRMLGDR